jgi:hypothetical protein
MTVSVPVHVPLTLETLELGELLSSHAATVAAIAHTTSHRRIAPSLEGIARGSVRAANRVAPFNSAQAMPGRGGIAGNARASESPTRCSRWFLRC